MSTSDLFSLFILLQGTVNPTMPSWMEKLHTKMCNTRTHHNIKLFIAKLVTNTAEVRYLLFVLIGNNWTCARLTSLMTL